MNGCELRFSKELLIKLNDKIEKNNAPSNAYTLKSKEIAQSPQQSMKQ